MPYIAIIFVDFLFGEMRIYSCRDFSLFFSLIFDDILMDLLKIYKVKSPHY